MPDSEPPQPAVSISIQLLAWLTGLGLCLAGLFDLIPRWSFGYALAQLVVLALAPVAWGWRRAARKGVAVDSPPPPRTWRHVISVILLMATSLGTSVWTSRQIGGEFPPVYHDEFSYLFQAKTFLAGRTWFPAHPTHPELFDQMHVLNDRGRMASRYFPGAGLWMAPFVALGHPYWGHWLCGMLTTAFIYAAGSELGGERVGRIAGLLTALSPGLAVFSNLLLAHHPTLVGLSFFLWRMSRLERTHQPYDALFAGVGLTWAMLCRPMTAAGFGLPFGIWTFAWLTRGQAEPSRKLAVFLGFAGPISLGLAAQLGYNASITGSPWVSPYQLYTDTYTPRHVYGFNNVARGERRAGPKVLDDYDRWAENLDGALAAKNVRLRLGHSLLWTWDALPLAMLGIVAAGTFWNWDVRRQLVIWSIVSLHAAHIPYWYTGIMHWHYVFETSLLWLVTSGLVIDGLLREWRASSRPLMGWWLATWAVVATAENWISVPEVWTAKVSQEAPLFRAPRRIHAQFREWTTAAVGNERALVLVAPHRHLPHLDFVVNDPGLSAPVLYGRYVPGKTDDDEIARDIPDRTVFLCEPDKHQIRRVLRRE